MKARLYIFRDRRREPLLSLEAVRLLAEQSTKIFSRRLKDTGEEAKRCPYYGARIVKGVTDYASGTTIVGVPRGTSEKLHGRMVQGLPRIDRHHRMYRDDHTFGFDTFIRWTAFAMPDGDLFLGVDYTPAARTTAGVATSAACVSDVAYWLVHLGFPENAELCLLNRKMLERTGDTAWRRRKRLISVGDWRAYQRFREPRRTRQARS